MTWGAVRGRGPPGTWADERFHTEFIPAIVINEMAARKRRCTALDFISTVKGPCFQRLTQEIIATGSHGSSRQLALQARPGWRRARNISSAATSVVRAIPCRNALRAGP